MDRTGYKLTRLITGLVLLLFAAGPTAAQQSPEEVLGAVVTLNSVIAPDARTAPTLGMERQGSGVVIDENGLILTIGYLILEAVSVSVTNHEGLSVEAKIVAYDHATGFGLVRATKPLNVAYLEFGDSASLQVDDPVLIISGSGASSVQPATVVSRREFSGYWEYLLDNAIFVSPPHRTFSGSALIDTNSRLVGIGSLIVSNATTEADPRPGNMFVPIDALKPVLKSLVETGRDPRPRRPWIGVYTEEHRGHVFVTRVAEDSPAERGGIRAGDIILTVAGEPVTDMATLYRSMWRLGEAGVEVPIAIVRSGAIKNINLKSTNRYQWLRLDAGRLTALLH